MEARQPEVGDAGSPLVEMLRIALPTVAVMTSYTVMQYVDGLMVSRIEPYDEANVAAQGNGGMAVWLGVTFVMGLVQVINTFVSQHLGAGRPERGSAYCWAGLWMALAWSLALLPAVPFVGRAFTAAGHEGALLAGETRYAQVLLCGAFFTLGARTIAQFFFGMHRPAIVLVGVVAGNLVNVHGNLLLIYGDGGMPATGHAWLDAYTSHWAGLADRLGIDAMGLGGAALATVIGSAVEMMIPLAIFLSPPMAREYGTRRAWRLDRGAVRDIVRIGWPGGLAFFSELLCWTVLMAFLLGWAGEQAGDDPKTHNAVGWVGLRYMHMSFMPTVGLSIAVSAMVGRCMGMGRPDLADKRARLGLAVGMVYMGACAIVFVVFRRELVGLFVPASVDPAEAERFLQIGAGVMIAAAVFQVFDAVAIITSAALRGAGDTVVPGVMTVVSCWFFVPIVGPAIVLCWPGIGSLGPWIGASAYIVTLGVLLLHRYLRGRWRSIRLVEKAEERASPTGP